MSTAIAYIGLGANLGDPESTLTGAIKTLENTPGILQVQHSGLYQSDPVNAPGPTYVNAVAKLITTLAPLPLLQTLRALETQHGRERSFRNAPRTLDLDLLLYDQLEFDTPTLIVPHPRMHSRAFVLKPLIELAGEALEIQKIPVSDWLTACTDQFCSKL